MDESKLRVRFYCADQNPWRDRSKGITNYTSGLLGHLFCRQQISLSAIVSRSSFRPPAGIACNVLPFRTDHLPGRLVADHLHPLLIRDEADLWHYPKGFLPLGLRVNAKRVGTVADTIIQHYSDRYPKSRSRANLEYWLMMLRHSIENFDLVLTVSEFSKRSIQEFCGRYSLRCPPIVVTYEGSDIAVSEGSRKEDYVVHLASKQPHKRTKWLIEVWARLQHQLSNLPRLRLIGDTGSDIKMSTLDNVEIGPFLTDQQYNAAIAGAQALILPSEIEGFGLPALEAYYLETPVVYVRDTAVEEVLGRGTPGGFSLTDQDSLAQAITAVLQLDPAAVGQKRTELKSRFAWEKVASRTISGYRSIM